MKNLILNSDQFNAVYAAMVALNNVAPCDGLRISFPGEVNGEVGHICVEEIAVNVIRVSYRGSLIDEYREHYAGQAAFVTAYGLA